MLGLAIATETSPQGDVTPLCVFDGGNRRPALAAPLVVDLSWLCASPLAASLKMDAVARVVKVEGAQRLDGARGGHSGFFNLHNAGKSSIVLHFAAERDLDRLKDLIVYADIVIEALPVPCAAQSWDHR